jgi:hypothetical protein
MNLTIAQPKGPPVEAADAERAEYVRRVIAARRPELAGADLASHTRPEVVVPREVAKRIEDALELIVARLDAIEERLDCRRVH